MRLRSVYPSLSGKNWLRDVNGKGTVGCGWGIGLSRELVGDVRGSKKMFFCVRRGFWFGMTLVEELGWGCLGVGWECEEK